MLKSNQSVLMQKPAVVRAIVKGSVPLNKKQMAITVNHVEKRAAAPLVVSVKKRVRRAAPKVSPARDVRSVRKERSVLTALPVKAALERSSSDSAISGTGTVLWPA